MYQRIFCSCVASYNQPITKEILKTPRNGFRYNSHFRWTKLFHKANEINLKQSFELTDVKTKVQSSLRAKLLGSPAFQFVYVTFDPSDHSKKSWWEMSVKPIQTPLLLRTTEKQQYVRVKMIKIQEFISNYIKGLLGW